MEGETLKAYLAGMWDADGSFGIAKRCGRYESYQPFALLQLTDRNAQHIFGLLEHSFGFQCYWTEMRLKNPKWRSVYRWALHSQKACDFASQLEPYLVIKKDRAQILMVWPKIENKMGFKARIPFHEKQKEMYEKMKLLNQRGNNVS